MPQCNKARLPGVVLVLLAVLLGAVSALGAATPNPQEVPAEGRAPDEALAELEPLPTMQVRGDLPYVDQYLEDGELADVAWDESRPNRRLGRRLLETELVYHGTDDEYFGDATEQGLRTRWRQETLNWGELDAQLTISDIETDFIGHQRSSSEALFTFRQTGAALFNQWLINNTAGHQRTLIDSFLHSGYRIRLPTSPLVGITSEVFSSNKTIQWFMGKTGNYHGIALQQFETDGGELAGGSYRQRLSERLVVGGEFVKLKGDELIRDHMSLLLSGRFGGPDEAMQHDLHLLADDDGNLGLWADSRGQLPLDVTLRYGGFWLQPELAWMNQPIANDQWGAYVRADKRAYLYNFAAGYDYTQTGIDSSGLSSSVNHSIYLNGNYRVNRRVTLGLTGNLILREFSALDDDNQVLWRLSNFAYYRFPLGTGRIELYGSNLDSDYQRNNNEIYGGRLSYDWPMPQGLRLTTEGLVEEQRRFDTSDNRRQLGMLFRQDLFDTLSWGVNASLFNSTSDLYETRSGISVSADAQWRFLPDWYVNLSVVHNDTAVDPGDAGLLEGNTEFQSNSVWLTFGYAKASGQPLRSFGRSGGGWGTGSIRGQVFFDENNDSIRQPWERAARGVTVVLDGRYEARTDAQGWYEFVPVHTGPHQLTLITEDLPLPWGLYDEAPRAVNVRVRQTSEVDVALVQVN